MASRMLLRTLQTTTIVLLTLWTAAVALAGATGLSAVYGRPAATDFEVERVDGTQVSLSDLKGRVVLVNFWATWCPPCRQEMPGIERAWSTLRSEGLEVLAVNVSESRDTVRGFLAETGLAEDFRLVLDPGGAAMKAMEVRGLPTTIIVDKEGRSVYSAMGPREFDSPHIIGLMRELLEE